MERSTPPRPWPWPGYALALLTTSAVVLARHWILLFTGSEAPMLLFLPPVLAAAWTGGLGPGLAATVLSTLAADWFLLDPVGSLGVTRVADAVRLALFAGLGLMISLVTERHNQARLRLEREVAERTAAEAALRESQQRFARFMEHLPGLAWIKDSGGRYVYANRAALGAFGTPAEGLFGKTDREVFPPATAEMFETNDRLALASPDGLQTVEVLTWPDGEVHYSLVSKFPIPAPDGRPLVGGMAVDVTERQRAEHALRDAQARLSAALAAGSVGTFAYDLERGLVTGDEYLAALFGLDPGEAASGAPMERFLEAIHPEDRPGFEDHLREVVAGGDECEAEYRVIRAGGSVRWVVGRGRPERDPEGRLLRVVGAVVDLTDRKRAEEALQRFARENEALSRQLQEADRRKDEFLATLAHELRNPLAPLTHGLEILRAVDGDRASAQEIRDMMARQVQHLVRLVDDLLDVSRISSGKLQLRMDRVDLGEVIRAAVETSRPAVERGGHHLYLEIPEGPLWMHGDPVRLAQVVANLLNNAARYTEPGGRIHLSAAGEGGQVSLEVRDTGIGIPPDLMGGIFEMFAQGAPPPGGGPGGLGLGLPLARSLVEMHGGTLEASSLGPGQGSTFRLRLPMAPAALAPTPVKPARDEPAPGLRLLIVDDNVDAAECLRALLEITGHQVSLAHDGPTGLAEAGRLRPDAILLDIGLPGMDGYEVARRLEREGLRPPLLVALTGFGQEEDRALARQAGFDRHLVKPVGLDTILGVLAEVGIRSH